MGIRGEKERDLESRRKCWQGGKKDLILKP